jgi:transketolase
MRKAFINSLCELARSDERICLIIGDLGFSVVEPFGEEFPNRFLNAGVAEQNMMSMAAGWSLSESKIVFVYSIANFPTFRCFEQIRNDVCYHKANVKIVSVGGGLTYGSAGFSHHAIEDLAIMRALPGMVVSAPADAYETTAITHLAIDIEGPFFIRIGKNNEPPVHDKACSFEVGEPIFYRKEGSILFVSTGTLTSEVIQAASLLEKRNLKAAVIGMPVLKPLDEEGLKESLQTKVAVVTVEEHSGFGGLGSVISEIIADNNINIPLLRIHLPEFINHVGSQDELRRLYEIDKEAIASRALEFLNRI